MAGGPSSVVGSSIAADLLEIATTSGDTALMSAVDRDSFATLYRQHTRAVRSVLLARLGPRPELDDAMQEVFVTALQRLRTLRNPDAFGPWVLQIARNHAIDLLRRRWRWTWRTDEPSYVPPPSVEAAEALHAIRSLPDAYRETLLMRLVEGMTGPEIAAATGRRPLSVRVNLHRGMKLLRQRLTEQDE